MCRCSFFTCVLLSTLLRLQTSLAQPVNDQDTFQVAVHTPQAHQPPSPNTVVDPKNQVTVNSQPGSTRSRYTKALAQGNGATGVEGTYGTSTLKSVESGMRPPFADLVDYD